MTDMKLAINGVLRGADEAVVSVYDHGFLYGMGVFETFRTYGGVPFLLEEHLLRLAEACRELAFAYRPDPSGIRLTIERLLQANGLKDAYFRLSVTAGEEALGLPSKDYGEPIEIVYVKPLPPRDEDLYRKGKALQLLKLRRNTPEGPVRLKSFHYMNPILGKRELSGYPRSIGAEGLFLDGGGHVAEGLVSNVFFVKKGRLFTPDTGTGILPGITRGWVLRKSSERGLSAEEGFYTWGDFASADEIFLTNSIQEIVPVTRVFDTNGQERQIGDGIPGPVTAWFMEQYGGAVRAVEGGSSR